MPLRVICVKRASVSVDIVFCSRDFLRRRIEFKERKAQGRMGGESTSACTHAGSSTPSFFFFFFSLSHLTSGFQRKLTTERKLETKHIQTKSYRRVSALDPARITIQISVTTRSGPPSPQAPKLSKPLSSFGTRRARSKFRDAVERI